MKKRTIVMYIATALTMMICLNMVACTSDQSQTLLSEEELKQFITEDFGVSLTAMLNFDNLSMDEFYLLEPIHFNTVKKIKNPNIVIPVANESGYICYLYYVNDLNGYVSSMSSAITPLLNEVKKHSSENITLYQDEYDIYANVNDKWFHQQSDGSVEELTDEKIEELQTKFKKVKLVSTSLKISDEYTAVAKKSAITDSTSQAISATQSTTTAEPEFSGNDDYFNYTEHVIYENGEGITLELLSNPYKLGDSLENLGVRVVSIDEKLYIHYQSPYINIDKKINGEWVRLKINRGENAKVNGSFDEVSRNRRNEILGQYNVYHMFDCEITPALTAGEYRFIAYFSVGTGTASVDKGNVEIRQYHIPFEIVE